MSENLGKLHGGEIEWAISKKYGIPIKKVISFASTVSEIQTRKSHKIISKFNLLHLYPQKYPYKLIEILAQGKRDLRSKIIVGNGSEELIYLFAQAICREEVIIPIPTYSSYEVATKKYGIKNKFVRLGSDFDIDLDKIKDAVSNKTSAIFLCNPNNPTGKLYSKNSVLELAKLAKEEGIKLLIDENYLWFTEKKNRHSNIGLVNKYPVFVINGMSKFFGVPSLRLGWGIGNQEIVDEIRKFRVPWSVNSIAISVAEELLSKYKNDLRAYQEFFEQKRIFHRKLSKLEGVHVFPSETNFFFIKILDERIDAKDIFEELAKKGIIVRDGSQIRGAGPRFLRVTVKDKGKNDVLVKNLEKLLSL
ncbi:MAG: histidinol-phosphate aminotransferase family protein [Candidatus Micrarchaeota archaeon]|nr:histidinol-phosphate aminotransferase family protein [Candidatus Micrarchaeota archaeon]